MKRKTYILFGFVLLFFCSKPLQATHIVGGEMNYRCLGNDLYEITLTIFRDCYYGVPDFDDPASIGVFYYDPVLDSFILDTSVMDMDVDSLGQIMIEVTNNDTLAPVLSDPCFVIPPDVCVNTTTYKDTVLLPFRSGGYTLAYQRCCRNHSIQNIEIPEDMGGTYPVVITEEALLECNSNAKFNDWPPIFICVNEPIEFDHSATDIDGDSLVYKLCTPYHGASDSIPQPQPPNNPPWDTVVWVDPPYDLTNVLGGVPLSIDSETGWLTGTPNTIGQFVVGVCVEEYRDGELISITRRDFQYNVGICGIPESIPITTEVSCEGTTVTFDNGSLFADSYTWYFNDPTNPGATSNAELPTYTYPDTGTYTVELVITGQLGVCPDTGSLTFSLYEPSLFPDFEYDLLGCDPISLALTDLSSDTVFALSGWEWAINGVPFSNSQVPPEYLQESSSDSLFIALTVMNEPGCESTVMDTIDFGLGFSFENLITTCEPENELELMVDTSGTADILNINWSPSNAIISGGNTLTPTVNPNESNIFYFDITYNTELECVYSDSILVPNEGTSLNLSITATPDTIFQDNSSQLEVLGDSLVNYIWSPESTLNDPTIFDPIATPEENTTYEVIATDAFGCMDTISILVVVVEMICDDPFVFMPNAFTPNGDNENDVLKLEGRIIDEMYLTIYNRWGQKVFETSDQEQGWDGTFKGELLEPDVYGFYLRVRCINGAEYFKKGNINLLR